MGREVKPTDMTVVPVTSQEPPLPPPSSVFFPLEYPGAVTRHSSSLPGSTAFLPSCQAAPAVGTKDGHCVLGTRGTGASRTSQGCGTGGKTSTLGIHGGWKLLYTLVCIYLCSLSSRVYIYVDHLHGPSCCNVFVSMLSICVQ